MARRRVVLRDLGTVGYRDAWEIQKEVAAAVTSDDEHGELLLVEHPPVLTFGRLTDRGDFDAGDADRWRAQGIEVVETDRGGKATYHGPGQIVVYPILALRRFGLDLHSYIRALEDLAIRFLATYGIEAGREPGRTGAWVGRDKVAAIGVHVRRWVSTHGMAVNVNVGTAVFRQFTPCGISDRGVTSVRELLGREVDMGEAKRRVASCFAEVFGADLLAGSTEGR